MKKYMKAVIALLVATACIGCTAQSPDKPAKQPSKTSSTNKLSTAIFAGGCFWCMESDFEKLPGVITVESGYIAGRVHNPSYEQVSAGGTGHAEAVRIRYNPKVITYQQLLDHFWINIDPTVADRQFCDTGSQYRSGIYPLDEIQKDAALASKVKLEKSGRLNHVTESSGEAVKIHTEIKPASTFYVAEEYHQDYYKKNPLRYKLYRTACGRDARLRYLWKK